MPPKKHAWCGPSSIARVLACPPSARFSEKFPDTESEYALEGTEAHELCEYLVRKAMGEKVRNPKSKFKFYSEEMQECAESYAGYVMEMYETAKQSCPDAVLMLEQNTDVSAYIPERFLTTDCILIADGTMTVCDYKHGKGIPVDAADNPQLKTYALGALDMFECLYDINNIRLVIFQPRLENIGSWEISKADLLRWAENTLKPTAQLAYNGEGEFCAGDHCRFCRAKAVTDDGKNPYSNPEVFGITAMEKLLGKKRFNELLGKYIEKPKGAPTLVPDSDRQTVCSRRPEYNSFDDNFK